MNTFPLTIGRTEVVAPPAAWLIPGSDAAVWIDELSAWDVPMESLRLYVLSRSVADLTPLGVLVTGIEQPSKVPIGRAHPYRLVADRLYIPADAYLTPSLSDAELKAILIWEVQVLRPSAGLIGCRRDEGLCVADLLQPPPAVEQNWDCAARPTAYAPRLLAVEAEVPPTMETILQQGRDGIGSEPLAEMPPDEDDSEIARILARVSRPGIRFIQWLTSNGAAGAKGAGWKDRVRKWADEKKKAFDQTLEDARLRELRRLQKLFETNPDEALKFALPFRDTGSRGVAPPSNKLSSRNPNFDMNRLAGGRPADSWAVPPDTQRDLITRYRAAANRELNLHRYGRAAYIFAELLGDYSAAANALQQGRFYREAAALYRDRLKNLAAAAKCLKEGGLLLEAATLYEELGEFEVAGDLYTDVDHDGDAVRCFREALFRFESRGAPLDAARILVSKLHQPEEALTLLRGHWPGSPNATACLSAFFNLLERLNHHDRAQHQITELRDGPIRDDRVEPLTHIFATLATKHPSPGIRLLAADATRVVAGRRLADARGEEARSLVAAVTRLRPDDKLLTRDCARFLNPPSKTYKLAPASDKPRVISEFQLSEHLVLSSAASTGDTFFAIGRVHRERTFIFRGKWDGRFQATIWKAPLNASACLLQPAPAAQSLLLIPLGDRPPASIFDYFGPADFFAEPCRVGIPAWLPGDAILGAAGDETGVIWISHSPGGPHASISTFSAANGHLLKTQGPIEVESTMDGQFVAGLTPLVACRGSVILFTGRTVEYLNRAEQVGVQTVLSQRAIHAVAAPLLTRACAAVAFEEGAAVIWDEGTQRPFAQSMMNPKIGFTRGGFLVVATHNEAAVYRIDGFNIMWHCAFRVTGIMPIAVCAASKLNEIALIGSNGVIQVYEIPPHRGT